MLDDPLTTPDFLPVEEAYPLALERIAPDAVRLVWQMPAGYYLYQHAFRFNADGDNGPVTLNPEYPPALERVDEYFGEVQVYYDQADIVVNSEAPLKSGTLRIMSQGCADAGLCYPPRTQTFSIDGDGGFTEVDAAAAPLSGQSANRGDEASLLLMAAFAFIGGMILNLMPCVLPILSLKVVSFACAPTEERRAHGRMYSFGVIVSFVAVALVLMALRGTGQAIGWGFQLQSPAFVTGLAYLFVFLGLSMSGVIELGARFMNAGSELAAKEGASGSFFTGMLAVVVASPCTAPFMGTALGFALVQPPLTGLAVFLALGAGMAFPMLLLSHSEAARKLLPKPGPWTETLRQTLAFPLYATALWLFWVAGRQIGVDFMAAALLGALLLAMGLWLWRGQLLSRSVAVVSVLAAVALASWRPEVTAVRDSKLPEGAVAYSADTLQRLRGQGQAVFVDVTADWCITCLANEQAVLNSEEVRSAFEKAGVTYMIADWTDYDDDIAEFVASHGRSGIPLYVLYDADGTVALLPQLLRTQMVVDALREASPQQWASTD
ncbi:MAG: protein-disulfide reductase DsbD domain-containing protein [Pseudomonadota bacterium]